MINNIIILILFNKYRKRNEEERKVKNKQELENYENELKKDLEDKKLIVDQEQENLQKCEEDSKKELEEIKLSLETKKNDIIDYIINNIMEVKMEFPEMVKKRFVKKKKGKK